MSVVVNSVWTSIRFAVDPSDANLSDTLVIAESMDVNAVDAPALVVRSTLAIPSVEVSIL